MAHNNGGSETVTFILGLALGALGFYLYKENQQEVDKAVKNALENTRKTAGRTVKDLRNKTGDVLDEAGDRVGDYGGKLSETIKTTADDLGRRAHEAGESARARRSNKNNG